MDVTRAQAREWATFQPDGERVCARLLEKEPLWRRFAALIIAVVATAWLVVGVWL